MNGVNATTAETMLVIPAPTATLLVFVRCDGDVNVIELGYRALPDVDRQPFPRIGNLWGSSNFYDKPVEYAADRVDMWMGADWNSTQASQLRQANPWTVILTSINACEGPDGLPEECVVTSSWNVSNLLNLVGSGTTFTILPDLQTPKDGSARGLELIVWT